MRQGYYVIMACRNIDKATTAKDQISLETGSNALRVEKLDLSSMESVRTFVSHIDTDIYGLVCNAGVQNSTQLHYTTDGVEETFGVNYLSHFLLVNLLLTKTNSLKRIAVVSSSLHDPATGGPQGPSFGSAELMAHPKGMGTGNKPGFGRYATSKLCLIFFTYRLAELLGMNDRKDVMVNAFNPGLMAGTGLGRNSTLFTGLVWYYLLPTLSKLFKGASTPDRSGLLLSKLISDVKVSGKYFDLDKESKSSEESYDKEKANTLWTESELLCGIAHDQKWYSLS